MSASFPLPSCRACGAVSTSAIHVSSLWVHPPLKRLGWAELAQVTRCSNPFDFLNNSLGCGPQRTAEDPSVAWDTHTHTSIWDWHITQDWWACPEWAGELQNEKDIVAAWSGSSTEGKQRETAIPCCKFTRTVAGRQGWMAWLVEEGSSPLLHSHSHFGYFCNIRGDTQDHISQTNVSACQLLTSQSLSPHTTDMLKISTDFCTAVPTGTDPKHRTSWNFPGCTPLDFFPVTLTHR